MSAVVSGLAARLLKAPAASTGVSRAALAIVGAVWNEALGEVSAREMLPQTVSEFVPPGSTLWRELCAESLPELVALARADRQRRYPDDRRRIDAIEITADGTLLVHWVDLENAVPPELKDRPAPLPPVREGAGTPIADKVLRGMKRMVQQKVVDLSAFAAGREHVEALQKTVASDAMLAALDPAHAVYVYAQNQASVMAEQLLDLKELSPLSRLLIAAADKYTPSGPPSSPLTGSFFGSWMLFDAWIGAGRETLGTITLAVGAAFGMHPELLRLIGALQASRMGFYLHEGVEDGLVVLRDMTTDAVCRALSPAGYLGSKGELWYIRVVPPAVAGSTPHVIMTTPYVIVVANALAWLGYFGVVPTRVPVAPVFWESLLPSTPCVSGPASHLNTCRLVPWQEQSGTTPILRAGSARRARG